MRYTTFQEDLIRAELLKIHDYGLDHTTSRLTWREVVAEIGAYSDLELEIEIGNDDKPLSRDEKATIDQKRIKHLAERLRQFVMGPDKHNPSKNRRLNEDVLDCVVTFLTHPEINRLTPETLAAPDVALDAGARLAEFIWDGVEDKQSSFVPKTMELYAPSKFEGQDVIVSLIFQKTQSPHLFEVAEVSEIHKEIQEETIEQAQSHHIGDDVSIDHGWAVVFPDQKIKICTKNLRTNTATFHDGFTEDEADRIYILNADIDQLLMLADTKILRVLRKDIFTIFSNDRRGIIPSRETAKATLKAHIKREFDKMRRRAIEELLNIDPLFGEIPTSSISRRPEHETVRERLFDCIRKNDEENFAVLLLKIHDINAQERDTGFSVLHYITYLSRRKFLRWLAHHDGIDFCLQDAQGRDPLTLAIQLRRDPVIVRFLARKKYQQIQRQQDIQSHSQRGKS